MRLINTSTLEFKEFLGDLEKDVPPYAILSHVWSDEEVSYDDYINGRGKESLGYRKVLELCRIARTGLIYRDILHRPILHRDILGSDLDILEEPGPNAPTVLNWAWIDTCCIDKRSSAELSEAINTMYKWYRSSAICLVFLPDLPPVPTDELTGDGLRDVQTQPGTNYSLFSRSAFAHSKWFTRGWTLQELLAPRRLLLYNTTFETIGHAHKEGGLGEPRSSLHSLIASVTSIDPEVIISGVWGIEDPYLAGSTYTCIAKRMSWMSTRITTRPEDIAYCLLGLFNVNMPLLYGEGAVRAFERLQLEILSRATESSLFLFDRREYGPASLLAPGPRAFISCTQATTTHVNASSMKRTIFHKTSRGYEFAYELPRGLRPYPMVMHHVEDPNNPVYFLLYPLNCSKEHQALDIRGFSSSVKRCYLLLEVWGPVAPSFDDYADHRDQAHILGVIELCPQDEYTAMEQALGWRYPTLLLENESFGHSWKYVTRARSYFVLKPFRRLRRRLAKAQTLRLYIEDHVRGPD